MRECFSWGMVITDDDIYPEGLGIVDFLNGLDTCINGNDEPSAYVVCLVNTLLGDAVAFIVAIRDVVG